MSDKRQLSVPVTQDRLLRFNIWCKVGKITQEEAMAHLLDNYVPPYHINLKEYVSIKTNEKRSE